MSAVGMKISVDGKDFDSAVEKDISFNSEYRTEKLVLEGSQSTTVPASTYTEIVVNHGLGYPPAFEVFHTFDGSGGYKECFGSLDMFETACYADVWVNSSDIHLYMSNFTETPVTRTWKYRIYARTMG